ncbi:hypothetical protein [Demequina mangrovi]|uniref:Uncharacterized protein n=1 Tax=Demequina mangrovi TaxID=1043493 RepID=A0A1H6WUX4_9MICO|nr:hypothetical protein [Demequina mangrovi]SEJ18097.1 hypothetical protein SAMN05421637_1066 [Demequina mangrovi]
MRWWLVGGVVAVLVVAALSAPFLPAASLTEEPVTGAWTLTEPESGACVEVTFDATLVGREVKPVVAQLPWRRWDDTRLVDTTIAVRVPDACGSATAAAGVAEIGGSVLVGDGECRDYEPWAADEPPIFDVRFGCGGGGMHLRVVTDEPALGHAGHTDAGEAGFHADPRGCVSALGAGALLLGTTDYLLSEADGGAGEVRACLARS